MQGSFAALRRLTMTAGFEAILRVLESRAMSFRPLDGKTPRIGENVFVADTARVIGDVEVGNDCSIWFGAVVRGDMHFISIGSRTNVQDNTVIHVTPGT